MSKPLFFAGLVLTVQLSAQLKYPLTEKQQVSDDYFGTKVEDPYRWLEDDRSPKTEAWVKEQNVVTKAYLDKIPFRTKIKTRLTELWNFGTQSAPFRKGDKYFCYKNNGLQNQSVLYIKSSIDDPGKILLDPNTWSADGTSALSGLSISNNGKILAYGLSKAGSDWTEIHFMDIDSRQSLLDELKWVKFSGMSWKGDGIYYSRYAEPTGSERSQKNQFHKVYYHKLGTKQSEDILVHEDKEHPNYNFGASVTDDEKYLIIYTSQSTSGEMVMVKDLTVADAQFVSISNNFDHDYSVVDHLHGTFFMITNHQAPNFKLVTFTLERPTPDKWITILPEKQHLLEQARLTNGSKILASYLQDVASKVYCYTIDGTLVKEIKLPGLCRVGGIFADKKYDFATYSTSQFVAPSQSWYLDAKTWQSRLLFSPNCKFDSKNYVTEQVFFPSKDGTMIPMFITHRKDVMPNPATPCFVYGYGGFNISIAPEFRIDRTVFLEAGGIYCVPNLRGGGEYGENWHKAGTKCSKQLVFDDFIAACEYLVEHKMTSYAKIAIHGRSNGGLLVGAVMTQRPDICKVALPAVGVLDMLRFQQFTIGRAWTSDYGSSENKTEFDCLLKYSPLHNVKETNYPATLILTGDHDDRVVPAHSFKFAATLQEKNKSKEPMLIRIDVNAGHGAGKPTAKTIEEAADMWSFVFYNLGIKPAN